MDKGEKLNLYESLIQLTDEESQILEGTCQVDKSIYTDNSQFIIDSNKLLNNDELIKVRKHTRFIAFPKHKHNYIEFNYVYNGKLTQIIDGRKLTLSKGDIVFLNKNIIHEIEKSEKEDIIINFIIKPEFFDYVISLIDNNNPVINFLMRTLYTNYDQGEYLYFKVAENKEVQDIIEKIIIELYENNIFSNARSKLLVGILLIELAKSSDDLEGLSTDDYEKKIIIEIIKYIEENYKYGTLLEISSILRQNYYKVGRLIKKHLGCTFKDLLQEKRLIKSEELLMSTNLPISEIIELVGYENLTYFYKIFKSKYKMTPKNYRNKYKLV